MAGVKFANIFLVAFLYQSFACSFFCTYILGLYFLGARILAQKLLLKCLVKLTPLQVLELFCTNSIETGIGFLINEAKLFT
jgi:hypothetical protein